MLQGIVLSFITEISSTWWDLGLTTIYTLGLLYSYRACNVGGASDKCVHAIKPPPLPPLLLQALYCTQGWGVTQPTVCRGEGGSGLPTVHREHRVIPRLSATNTVALFLFLPSVAKAQGKRLLDMPSWCSSGFFKLLCCILKDEIYYKLNSLVIE